MRRMTETRRPDGRAADALRPVRITPGALKFAEGSVLIEVGDTRVLCAASVSEQRQAGAPTLPRSEAPEEASARKPAPRR